MFGYSLFILISLSFVFCFFKFECLISAIPCSFVILLFFTSFFQLILLLPQLIFSSLHLLHNALVFRVGLQRLLFLRRRCPCFGQIQPPEFSLEMLPVLSKILP